MAVLNCLLYTCYGFVVKLCCCNNVHVALYTSLNERQFAYLICCYDIIICVITSCNILHIHNIIVIEDVNLLNFAYVLTIISVLL